MYKCIDCSLFNITQKAHLNKKKMLSVVYSILKNEVTERCSTKVIANSVGFCS